MVKTEILKIGQVQGVVATDEAKPESHRSPMNGEKVAVQGVIHQLIQWSDSRDVTRYGFLMQEKPADADGDPLTSDGLYVYCSRAPVLKYGAGNYTVRVGDEVTVHGLLKEHYSHTSLSDAVVLKLQAGGDVDKLLPATPLQLSAEYAETKRILERHEGMRVSLAAGATSLSGRHEHGRSGDSTVWITPAENPVLGRKQASHRRVFRDPHPLDDVQDQGHDNENGYRLEMGSLGLKGASASVETRLPDLHTGMVFEDVLVGGITFNWGSYRLQPVQVPGIQAAESPADWKIDWNAAGEGSVRIATYNVENLYDFYNDPDDGCDFANDRGCPGVRKPFDYVPASDKVYRKRLNAMAHQILHHLDAPELILVQETEDQDQAELQDGVLVFGKGDGELDSLQDLCLAIVQAGGPEYRTAADRDAADTRGIVCGYLYQPGVFRLAEAKADDNVLGSDIRMRVGSRLLPLCQEQQNPKAFDLLYSGPADGYDDLPGAFSRPMQVACFEWVQHPERRPLWVLNNHFTSRPDKKVDRRRQQATMNAAIAKRLIRNDSKALVIVGGDLNVFPRPDDPFVEASDQLGPLYDAALINVYDWIEKKAPETAYSYVYAGQPGTLDHMFLSPALNRAFVGGTYLHVNADWSDDAGDQEGMRASDHDPLLIEIGL